METSLSLQAWIAVYLVCGTLWALLGWRKNHRYIYPDALLAVALIISFLVVVLIWFPVAVAKAVARRD